MKKGHIKGYEWLEKLFPPVKIFNTNIHIVRIIKYGNINIIEWAIKKYNISDENISKNTVIFNRSDIIDWMIKNNRKINIKSNDLTIPSKLGYLDLLKKIYQLTGVLPNRRGANFALVFGKDQTFKWIESHGIFPDEGMMILAASKNRSDIIKEYEAKGFPLSQELVDKIVQKRNIDMLDWLETKGFIPSQKGINKAFIMFNLITGESEFIISPKRKELLDRIIKEQEILRIWLAKRGLFPFENLDSSDEESNEE